MLIVEITFFCGKNVFNKLDMLTPKNICKFVYQNLCAKAFETETIKSGEVLTSSCLDR